MKKVQRQWPNLQQTHCSISSGIYSLLNLGAERVQIIVYRRITSGGWFHLP
jgi:hypothetical protein